MLRKRIIPILLLKEGGLVKGVQYKNHRYVGDPINAVKIFNDKNADELIFLDIGATSDSKSVDVNLVESIADYSYVPFTVGGGISDINQIKKLLLAGAEKVALNSSSITNPNFIRDASNFFGSSSIVVSIDIGRDWLGREKIFFRNGQKKTNKRILDWVKKVEELGAGELLVNSISRDGTMKGYDLILTEKIASRVKIPVIASGGAGTINHISDVLKKTQASAAAAGSLFVFHGKKNAVLINYPSVEDKKELVKNEDMD